MLYGHLPELIVVLVIALVFFGPKRLPELGSSIGKGIREFRKATTELQEGIKVDAAEPLPQQRSAYTASDYAPHAPTTDYVATPAQPGPRVHENETPRV